MFFSGERASAVNGDHWKALSPLLVPRMPFRVVCVFETRVSFNLGWLQIGQ